MISLKHCTNIRRADTSKCNTKYSKAHAIKVGLRPVMFRTGAFKKRNQFPLANKKVYIDRIPSDSREKVHNYFIFSHLFKEIHSRNIIAESCKSVKCLSNHGRVVRRVVFTAMLARLTVQLPTKPGCCVLEQDASPQLS